MIFTNVLNVLDFRTNTGITKIPLVESLSSRIYRISKEYLISLLTVPVLILFGCFFYSPVEFWPILIEILSEISLQTAIILYAIVYFIIEVLMNMKFAENVLASVFIPFVLPKLRSKQGRRDHLPNLNDLTFGFTRIATKLVVVLLICGSFQKLIG